MVFKPDFTKADPWAGMPPDYAGVATFIPTATNPLPPWEGEVAAAVIPTYGTPDYNARAQNIIDEARVTAYIGTLAERQRAALIVQTGERAMLARTGVVSVAPETPPSAKLDIDWSKWAMPAVIGVVALALIMRR